MRDRSMEPSFYEGDRVITFNWGKIYAGNVIVFEKDGKDFIKRVDKITRGQIYVSGDNKVRSAKIGPVDRQWIVGKVILKY